MSEATHVGSGKVRELYALDDERLLLEAASVVGVRFAAPTLAAALERDVVEVEERCAARAAELRERRRRVGRASRST